MSFGAFTSQAGGILSATLTWNDNQTALELYLVAFAGAFVATDVTNLSAPLVSTIKAVSHSMNPGTPYYLEVNYYDSLRNPKPFVDFQLRIQAEAVRTIVLVGCQAASATRDRQGVQLNASDIWPEGDESVVNSWGDAPYSLPTSQTPFNVQFSMTSRPLHLTCPSRGKVAFLQIALLVAGGSACAHNPAGPTSATVDQMFSGTIGAARGCSPFLPFRPAQDVSNSCVPYGPYTAALGGLVNAILT